MKRFVFTLIVAMMALYGAANDRFYIEDFTIALGETRTVAILLDNEMEYTAFQSDVYLPDGFTAANFALTDRKNSNHTLTATVLPNGGIRLLSYSLKLKTYSGNSGALVTFDVTASDDFADTVVIALRNTLFTTEAGIEVTFNDETCSVTLPLTVLRGDVNDDMIVDILDATALINYLLYGNLDGINVNNADCSIDGVIDILDATALINFLLYGTW